MRFDSYGKYISTYALSIAVVLSCALLLVLIHIFKQKSCSSYGTVVWWVSSGFGARWVSNYYFLGRPHLYSVTQESLGYFILVSKRYFHQIIRNFKQILFFWNKCKLGAVKMQEDFILVKMSKLGQIMVKRLCLTFFSFLVWLCVHV